MLSIYQNPIMYINIKSSEAVATFDRIYQIWYAQRSMRYPWLPALSMLGIGFYIAACLILGTLGGRWLDQKLNTAPLWIIIGFFIGIAVAFIGVYRMIKPFMENNKKDKGSK